MDTIKTELNEQTKQFAEQTKQFAEACITSNKAGQAISARDMTVEELIKSRIERKQREIAELMQLSDSLPYEMRQMGCSKFEHTARLFFPEAWR